MVDDPLDVSPPRQLVPAQPTGMSEGGLPFSAPAWSPDGTKIAYTELLQDPVPGAPEPVYHTAVFVIGQDGTGRAQVTHPHDFRPDSCDTCVNGGYWSDWSPSWSPDGSKIAFIRLSAVGVDAIDWPLRSYNVWIASAGGGGEQQITSVGDNAPYSSVIWSPDGSRLAAMRASAGGYQIVTLKPTGGAVTVVGGSSMWSDYDWAPDGTAIVATRITGAGYQVVRIDATIGEQRTLDTTFYGAIVRATTDGNGALYRDCQLPPGDCGLYVAPFDDPTGDVFSDEPTERRWAANPPSLPATGPFAGGRSPFDVQPQQLPVIFVPGFLGSEIMCNAGTVWPKPAGDPLIDFRSMGLDIDGKTNAVCAGAGPTGSAVMTFDAGPKSQPVYGPTVEHMTTFTDSDGNARGYVYGWDWRKAPQESLAGLDALIDQALSAGVPAREGATRVVLYGHSYGGLLIRTYIDNPAYAQRVARVLTVGTPYWGSPKSIFPLAFGIETPEPGAGLDWFSINSELRSFAQNLAGLYQLYPSDSFGQWLQLNGAWLDQAGVQQEVFALGGNPALWAQARQNHQQIYDHFFDDSGRIDVRAVVGTGVPTFGEVNLMPGRGQVLVGYVNGDHTVPATSAMQDSNPAAEHPAGDPGRRVHVQRICGVEHMAESSDPAVLSAYDEFLDHGHRPRRTGGGCSFSGFEAKLLTVEAIDSASARASAPGRAQPLTFTSATPLTLADAAIAGLIDVARVPGQWIVVTSDRDPVALTFTSANITVELTPISDSGRGATLRYGPMSGTVEIQPVSSPGEPPTVTDDGTVVLPQYPTTTTISPSTTTTISPSTTTTISPSTTTTISPSTTTTTTSPSTTATTTTSTSTTSLSSTTLPPVVTLDHFLCHRAKAARRSQGFQKILGVRLDDQLEDKKFDVLRAVALCNPADKNLGGIRDDSTLLKAYQIKEARLCPNGTPCRNDKDCPGQERRICQKVPKHEKRRNILVTNQLGDLLVDTVKPERLLVPSAKDLDRIPDTPDVASHAVDNYKCYQIRVVKKRCLGAPATRCKKNEDCGLSGPCSAGFPKGVRVEIWDQFAESRKIFDVKKPSRLCTPTDTSDEVKKSPEAHLMCYQVKQTKGRCAGDAPANPGGGCGKEEECGGRRKKTSFCIAQPRYQKRLGIHVSDQFGPERLDTVEEEEFCVPSLTNPRT